MTRNNAMTNYTQFTTVFSLCNGRWLNAVLKKKKKNEENYWNQTESKEISTLSMRILFSFFIIIINSLASNEESPGIFVLTRLR